MHYSLQDIVIPCETDEIIDLNEEKLEIFEETLNQNQALFYISRMIFCYDFGT